MKKLLSLVLLLGLLIAVTYLVGSVAVEKASRRALPLAAEALASQGAAVTEIDFESARLGSIRSVVWRGVRMSARLPEDSAAAGQAVRVNAAEVELSMKGFSFRRFQLEARDLVGSPDAALSSGFDWASSRFREAAQRGQLIASRIRVGFDLGSGSRIAGFGRVADQLVQGLRQGRTTLPIEVDAGVLTQFDGETMWVRLGAPMRDGIFAITVDPDDLRRQADHFSRPLTDGEVTLVAENPLKAPGMLLIKKYAENTASEAHKNDLSVPEDAYRHVLWSFLLTKKYGAGFAEQVTDAHEVGSTTNTAADHRMDYNNNAVGRRYAAGGIKETEILSRVRTDRGVIRQPR
jgi:hypothetical protein